MKYYTVTEVAKMFDCHYNTVLNWIAKGKLDKEQIVPRGKIRIPEISIEFTGSIMKIISKAVKQQTKLAKEIKKEEKK